MVRLFDSPFTRRNFVLGAGLAGAEFALPGLAAGGLEYSQGRDGAGLRLDDPRENLRLYVKMNGDLSGKPYLGWFAGHVFATASGRRTTPLFAIEGFGQGWTRPGPGGVFRSAWKEVGFYKDLRTNQVIETWRNPFNNEVCDVMHIHNRHVNWTMRPQLPDSERFESDSGQADSGKPPLDDSKAPFLLRWFTHRDTVAVSLDSRLSGPNPLDPREWPMESTGGQSSVTEFNMQIADRRELLDPARSSTGNTGQWTRICGYLPWMLMGQAPGDVLYRCVTKKLGSVGDLPAPLRAYTEKNYREFLEVPTEDDFRQPIESSWEVFKRERRPRSKSG